MELIQLKKCTQDNCTISNDGKCLEGLETESCPHFYLSDSNEETELKDTQQLDGVSSKSEKLFTGSALSIKELSLITHAYKCQKIFILGESNSGKTTLLGYIFDKFQKQPFGDFYFSGSLTQRGFDERCHYSRTSSHAAIPHTEKTINQAFDFLHLAVKEGLDKPVHHLLISDISGEKLRDAAHSSIIMNELRFLEHADKVIIVLDGENIIDKKVRQTALFNAQNFIQRALDENIFNSRTDLQITLSKWDHFISKDSSFDFNKIVEVRFNNLFSHRLGKIRYSKISASPKLNLDEIEIGFGVHDLFKDWVIINGIPKMKDNDLKKVESSRYFRNFNY